MRKVSNDRAILFPAAYPLQRISSSLPRPKARPVLHLSIMRQFPHLLAVVLALSFASYARASDTWTITTADFRTQDVELRAIDSAGVHVGETDSSERVISPDSFLQADRQIP